MWGALAFTLSDFAATPASPNNKNNTPRIYSMLWCGVVVLAACLTEFLLRPSLLPQFLAFRVIVSFLQAVCIRAGESFHISCCPDAAEEDARKRGMRRALAFRSSEVTRPGTFLGNFFLLWWALKAVGMTLRVLWLGTSVSSPSLTCTSFEFFSVFFSPVFFLRMW
ncbi:uncharacterized protein [Physcomitrium patens]|uniref:uncharacterized protein n=1 Tax=Physcomitrium patens TaxID=3218 RepID=UPI003CCD8B02